MTLDCALDLPIPRNMTALLQHLQSLTAKEQLIYHCGGFCPLSRLDSLVLKLGGRYPLTRNPRQRSYDRDRGHAVVHLVVYPHLPIPVPASRGTGVYSLGDARAFNARIIEELHRYGADAKVVWWLLSDDGNGGLADRATEDARVSHQSTLAGHAITHQDYVLQYAHKKVPTEIADSRTGKVRKILRGTSTWTWRMHKPVINEVMASIRECCRELHLGQDTADASPSRGLLGLLSAQRARPLFSGVRTQVIALEKYAREQWRAHGGDPAAFVEMSTLMHTQLPKMIRMSIYNNPRLRIRDLLRASR